VTCRRLQRPEAATALAAGGVLILPTDTLPGLHARADNAAAVARIHGLKGRAEGKPLVVLAGSLAQARSLLRPLNREQERICVSCWPGPYTLILPGAGLTAAGVAGEGGGLAVRVPGYGELRELVLEAGGPLVSTSANRAGAAPAADVAAAVAIFGTTVDGYWDGGVSGPRPAAQASCLVDFTGAEPKVLRDGPLPFPPPAEGRLDGPSGAV